MNLRILNREFQHPADGWYQIEASGHHPNRAAGMVQVIDAEAVTSIVNRFNADAAAGQLRHGNEMLIDHEHFSDQQDQESRAYGWLQELQNREDGIYGRIRWTATGKTAVDGGDYRFFSTEYEPGDLQSVERGARNAESGAAISALRTPKSPLTPVRPMRLAGLTLTNMNNNRGQKPITNRSGSADIPVREVQENTDQNDRAPQNFAGSGEPADNTDTNKTAALTRAAATTKNQRMKTVCTLLGLSADAEETSIHAAVSKLLNRGDIAPDALATLRAEHKSLGELNQMLLAEQLDGLLAEHGIKDAKIINRLTPVLTPLKNRAERLACLADLGFKAQIGDRRPEAGTTGRVLNRGTGNLPSLESSAADEQGIARKIKNRANELKGASPGRAFDDCWNQATAEILKS